MAARMPPELIAEVEAWATANDTTRSAAFRRLVELGLAGAKKSAAPSQQTRAKAKKFAAEQIDRMGNSTATAEEQASRKQRLLKGPEEFRRRVVRGLGQPASGALKDAVHRYAEGLLR